MMDYSSATPPLPKWVIAVSLLLLAVACLSTMATCNRIERVEVPVIQEKIVEKIVEVEVKPPLPSRAVDYGDTPDDLVKLYNGFQIRTTMEASEGKRASLERKDKGAYEIEYRLKLRVPKASDTLADLATLNEQLPAILPGLANMMPTAKVSGFYHLLYKLKTERVQRYLTRLKRIPSRHNFFDCETVLELKHPQSEQRVLLIQGEMDVVSDGSDGDRMPEYDEYIASSSYYQPFTSYGWKKQTDQPNPLLSRWEEKLSKATNSSSIKTLKAEIADLKARSFLIARKDPFVVVPTSFVLARATAYRPRIGDYCVVIYGDKIYPAILGDSGPTYKSGEASLRMAQEISKKASPYNRPVSDLTVTYIIFPQSRDQPFGPPDLKKWHARCEEYLGKIGGLGEGYQMHVWEDLFAPEEDATEEDPS
ncbi:MAG: glycoside hydrolase family 75 protein [Verrucomicrobiales bacterium]|nr:glycoside hydrolase family 75 protein [Verrucomicrobiales bacterium]